MSESSDTWDVPAWATARPTTGSYSPIPQRPVTARQEFTYPRRGVQVYPRPIKVEVGPMIAQRQVTAGCVARVQASFLLLAWLGIALILSWIMGG